MTTLEKIIQLLAEQFDVEPNTITEGSTFEHTLNADSLDKFEIILAIEEHFGIDITDDEFDLLTVGDLVALVERKRVQA